MGGGAWGGSPVRTAGGRRAVRTHLFEAKPVVGGRTRVRSGNKREIHASGHVVPGAGQGHEGGDTGALVVSLMLNPGSY